MGILPDSISCKVFEGEKPAVDIMLSVKFYADHKNDHFVLSLLTNQNGETILFKEYIEEESKRVSNFFIMDYSPLHGCFANKIDVEVMTQEKLKKCLGAYNMYGKDLYRNKFKKDLDKAIKVAESIDYSKLSFNIDIVPKDTGIVLRKVNYS